MSDIEQFAQRELAKATNNAFSTLNGDAATAGSTPIRQSLMNVMSRRALEMSGPRSAPSFFKDLPEYAPPSDTGWAQQEAFIPREDLPRGAESQMSAMVWSSLDRDELRRGLPDGRMRETYIDSLTPDQDGRYPVLTSFLTQDPQPKTFASKFDRGFTNDEDKVRSFVNDLLGQGYSSDFIDDALAAQKFAEDARRNPTGGFVPNDN